MSGGWRQAKLAGRRPLDGRVRASLGRASRFFASAPRRRTPRGTACFGTRKEEQTRLAKTKGKEVEQLGLFFGERRHERTEFGTMTQACLRLREKIDCFAGRDAFKRHLPLHEPVGTALPVRWPPKDGQPKPTVEENLLREPQAVRRLPKDRRPEQTANGKAGFD